MDSGGYDKRTFFDKEKNVGGTHGLYMIFFLLEHVTTVVPALCFIPAAGLTYALSGGIAMFLAMLVAVPVVAVTVFAVTMVALSHAEFPDAPCDWTKYIDITDAKLAAKYKGRKIPIETFVDAYMSQRAEFVADPLEVFWHRHEVFLFCITLGHAKFFLTKFTGQLIHHTQAADTAEVRDVYDRGNDFYRWFLGPRMIYTSGIFESQEESLEDAQDRKMDLVCRKTHMKPGDEHLDIGCGWGTLLAFAAKNYGTKSTGVTLAREQCKWGMAQAKDWGVEDRVQMLCMDYRDIPKKQYNVITSLEMIEHVGIKNVQSFLLQCKDMLVDDGLFYLQLAGLRRAWQFEDLIWGLFMGSFIFPGADASCPLAFITSQAERAGFEVHSMENCGVHYALTINHWYNNWLSNKDEVVAKYGQWWYRCWVVFLAWSVIVASQGSSTVFLLVLHKNTSRFERRDTFVGPYPIATQQ
ncbi:Sphingolipid C9-methyltransferase [Hondaea fermentalgiana]|uniref:sphingolipid C(9)-methyltransferase n=1 Tax=Hondaea fermentalgiana TaxID=2315210 RepID=A0A2R5G9S9_9STRA|nr:Sphingolipid C9-methyltransferase [Hondaea fermentalgiana]|eukprot:GBG25283.1 Sphingolipid C9-methyltransferase [Hondaea fermentalgiana]